jgi:subtilisin family serine protease
VTASTGDFSRPGDDVVSRDTEGATLSVRTTRLRSAVLTVVAVTAVSAVATPLPAAAAPTPAMAPDRPPAADAAPEPAGTPGPAGPATASPEEIAPVEPEGPPPGDGTETVSAIVTDDEGTRVVSVETLPAEVDEVQEELAAEPDVVDVFVDSTVGILAADTHRPEQWNLPALDYDDLPAAHDGAGLTVAVLDTGVRGSHPDLAGRVDCARGADFTGATPATSVGDGCTDPHGHGTHVAGTISAISDNGRGIAGLSRATIMPVRVLDGTGYGSSADIIAGIYWAIEQDADVINMSIGGDAVGDFDTAVQAALDAGVVVIAAAGNNRLEGNTPEYPGATPGVISVASTDWLGLSSEFSYSGPTNWIAAPGSYITSTVPDGYAPMSGTSMSAPHVSAVVARYLDRFPGTSPADVRTALRDTAIDLERAGRDNNTGNGLIGAYELLTGLEPSRPTDRRTPPAAPVLDAVTRGNGSVAAHWSAPAWNGGAGITGYGIDVWTVDGDELFLATSATVPGTSRSGTVGGLRGGVDYAVSVYAVNQKGEGQWSAVSDALRVTAAPSSPRMGRPNAGPSAARVRWSPPASNGGSPVTGYVVKVYTGWTLTKTVRVPATARDVRIGGLRNGRAVTFLVQATNAAGVSRHSARSIKVTPMTRPSAARVGRVTPRDNAAWVSWGRPWSDGGSRVRSYVVRVYQGNRGIKSVRVSGRVTRTVITGLGNRRSYTFSVSAVNALGEGPRSARSRTVRTR